MFFPRPSFTGGVFGVVSRAHLVLSTPPSESRLHGAVPTPLLAPPSSVHPQPPCRGATSRVRKKWAVKYKPVGASHLALEFMDAHYPRLYGPKKWAMIRCAMLTRQKYSMLFNCYLPDSTVSA